MQHGTSVGLQGPQHRLWLLAAVIALILMLGFIGHLQYERAHHPGRVDLLSIAYHTAQLLILHAPHLEPPVPVTLHVARFLGAAIVFAAGWAIFLALFREQQLRLRLWAPWRQGHIVIAGLGDLGQRLARDARALRRFVVAIEKGEHAARVEAARRLGVLVLEGDARDAELLKRARIDRAAVLLACCDDDASNVAIASKAGSLLSQGTRSPELVCRLLVSDPQTRAALAEQPLFPCTGRNYRVNLADLDYHETAARQALRRHPLDCPGLESGGDCLPLTEKSDTVVHLVVVGSGPMAEAVLLHAVRMGHFANEVGRAIRLRVTIACKDAPVRWGDFHRRYPMVPELCDVFTKDADPSLPGSVTASVDVRRGSLVTFAVCGDDDAASVRTALALARSELPATVQILVHQTRSNGYAALFATQDRAGHHRIHPFGMIEEVFNWEVIFHEAEDARAKGLYEDYRAKRIAEGRPETENPPWDALSDAMRDSNRHAADHIEIKMRALGYTVDRLRQGEEGIVEFDAGQLLLLAQMEHLRWCAERRLAGWTPGTPTDRARKVNQNLVPWDELRPEEREKDPEQIRAIPKVLREAGYGIYPRQRPKA